MTRSDLHTHTSSSDGQLSPENVVRLAAQVELGIIAITDHDTTTGILPAQVAARGLLEVLAGIEIGAGFGDERVDILGYLIDPQHTDLHARMEQIRHNRLLRGQSIVERLGQIGMTLDWSRVEALANGAGVGRPHIARALVEAGYARSMKDAFDRIIGSDGPAYVPRETLNSEEAIQLIHAAGGVAVLAHPIYVTDVPRRVEKLVAAGLDGIEVNYPHHTPEIEAQARALARQYDLIMTGGSDFHGMNVPGKAMLGSTLAPDGAVEQLRECAHRYRNPA